MIANAALHRIRTGEATSQEARLTIRDLIAKDGAGASAALYTALRGWTWKALQSRRFDDELSEWFRVMRATAAVLAKTDDVTSRYIQALAHLVEESIRYGESHTRNRLIGRSHVGDILEIVRRHNGRIDREALEAETGLGKSRLSQLLSDLVIAGALDREKDGRHATFVLTDSGRDLLDGWRRSRAAEDTDDDDDAATLRRFDIPRVKQTDVARREDLMPVIARERVKPPTERFHDGVAAPQTTDAAVGASKHAKLPAPADAIDAGGRYRRQADQWVEELEHA